MERMKVKRTEAIQQVNKPGYVNNNPKQKREETAEEDRKRKFRQSLSQYRKPAEIEDVIEERKDVEQLKEKSSYDRAVYDLQQERKQRKYQIDKGR